MNKEKYKQIIVTNTTYERLVRRKKHGRQSFNEVITDLIDTVKEKTPAGGRLPVSRKDKMEGVP